MRPPCDALMQTQTFRDAEETDNLFDFNLAAFILIIDQLNDYGVPGPGAEGTDALVGRFFCQNLEGFSAAPASRVECRMLPPHGSVLRYGREGFRSRIYTSCSFALPSASLAGQITQVDQIMIMLERGNLRAAIRKGQPAKPCNPVCIAPSRSEPMNHRTR